MERVDWTQDEPPRCKDCVYAIPDLFAPNYNGRLECRKMGRGLNAEMHVRSDAIDLGEEVCGSKGKWFERDHERLGADFENYPPIGAWK